jgi:hypothetical protein
MSSSLVQLDIVERFYVLSALELWMTERRELLSALAGSDSPSVEVLRKSLSEVEAIQAKLKQTV